MLLFNSVFEQSASLCRPKTYFLPFFGRALLNFWKYCSFTLQSIFLFFFVSIHFCCSSTRHCSIGPFFSFVQCGTVFLQDATCGAGHTQLELLGFVRWVQQEQTVGNKQLRPPVKLNCSYRLDFSCQIVCGKLPNRHRLENKERERERERTWLPYWGKLLR